MKTGDTFQARRNRTGELVKRKDKPAVFVYEALHREPATMPDVDGSELINEWVSCTWAGLPRQLFTRLFSFERI